MKQNKERIVEVEQIRAKYRFAVVLLLSLLALVLAILPVGAMYASQLDLLADTGLDGVTNRDLIDAIYPVDCVFITYDGAFDPNTAFGGTWERDYRSESWHVDATYGDMMIRAVRHNGYVNGTNYVTFKSNTAAAAGSTLPEFIRLTKSVPTSNWFHGAWNSWWETTSTTINVNGTLANSNGFVTGSGTTQKQQSTVAFNGAAANPDTNPGTNGTLLSPYYWRRTA
jgi:hypothetical protein